MGYVRESALKADWEKNPLPHGGVEPASAVCWSDTLPTELHLHQQFSRWLPSITIHCLLIVVGQFSTSNDLAGWKKWQTDGKLVCGGD